LEKNVLVVANPVAGHGFTARSLPQVRKRLEGLGWPHTIMLTESKYGAETLVKDHVCHGYSDLVVVGGDGTLHQALNGMPRFDIPIGVVQTGTGNDFSKAMGEKLGIGAQIERALLAPPRPVDMGVCNGRYFANGVGIGFDGWVAHRAAELWTAGVPGVWAYYRAIARGIVGYQPFEATMRHDSTALDVHRLFMVTVGNGKAFGGGVPVCPRAAIDDGQLDFCAVERLTVPGRIWRLPLLMAGKHLGLHKVHYGTGHKVVIHTAHPVEAHLDGELLRGSNFEIGLAPHNLWLRW
jgi:YegS/Rv2252/BmrU family lipid kinase